MMSVYDRYQQDPAFRSLVDSMEVLIHDGRFTPTEIREAAIVAMTNHEARRIRHHYIIPLRELDQC